MEKAIIGNINDLARLAGVSKSTVSRALSGSPLISRDTTERIQKLAKVHGFYRDNRARCLSRGESRIIGCSVCNTNTGGSDPANTFQLELIALLSAKLHRFQYDLMIINTDEQEKDWPERYFQSRKADGFILLSLLNIEDHMERLLRMDAPFVTFGDDRPDLTYPTVVYDNRLGAEMAVEHLIRSGRRKIGYIRGPLYSLEADNREQGYRDALAKAGLPLPFEPVNGTFHYRDGLKAAAEILEQSKDIDALAVNCDAAAFGVIEAVHRAGLTVPDDIAVTGFDNINLSAHYHPPLTTVGQDMNAAALYLLENLQKRMDEKTVINTILKPELMIRKSS